MGMFNDAWGTDTPYGVIHSWDESSCERRELTLEEKAERDGLSVEEYLARQKKKQEERRLREEKERQRRVEIQKEEYACKHYKQLQQAFGVELHTPEEELQFVESHLDELKARFCIKEGLDAEQIIKYEIEDGLIEKDVCETKMRFSDGSVQVITFTKKYNQYRGWIEYPFETLKVWRIVNYRPAYDFATNTAIVKDVFDYIEKNNYCIPGNVGLRVLLGLFNVDEERVAAYKDASQRQYLFYDTNKSKMFWALYNRFVEPLYR